MSHHNLSPLVHSVNELLKHFGLVHWRHVYRRHNKMADGLANIAMDSRTTSTFTSSTTGSSTARTHFLTTSMLLEQDLHGLIDPISRTSHREITLTNLQRALIA